MELYYNTDALSEDRIKRTFVGRQWLLDELTTILRQQPEGAGVQHVLLIAPRGMGKTTMLLMLGYAVDESELKDRWQVVRFREESYNITDSAEFWMEALRQLRDPELTKRIEQIAAEYRKSADLGSAAVALIKDWVRSHGKRLLLLVENFDGILEQIHSEEENSRLRDVLMNDGSVMLIGAATSFFEEARGYEKPLYNFFKVYNLDALSEEQIQELLIRRSEVDGIAGFREKLKQNAGQIRALSHFTGGNPRLVLMLYAVIANAQSTEVRTGLEKLLDEVTPYFKARTELLPPQQRKILDQIARESARTLEGQSPTAFGRATRMTPNQVSAQLKRMSETGYVRAVNVRGRAAYYTLSEPLFALWYQMRFGRDARERMNWLVSFLRVWYDDTELGSEMERLCSRVGEMLSSGQITMAKDAVQYGRFLLEAIRDTETQLDALVRLVDAQLDAGEDEEAVALLEAHLNVERSDKKRALLLVLRINARLALADRANSLVETQGEIRRALSDIRDAARLYPPLNDEFRHLETGLVRQLEQLEIERQALEDPDASAGDDSDFSVRFAVCTLLGDAARASEAWRALTAQPYQDAKIDETIVLLTRLARDGHAKFLLETIRTSTWAEPLAPLLRALEYVESGDRDIIEKLSPEVRLVVEDLVARIQAK